MLRKRFAPFARVARRRTGLPSPRGLTALVTVVALVLSVAGAVDAGPPPVRATPAAVTVPCERGNAVSLWQAGGPLLKAAAQTALLGGDAQVCAFVATGWQQPRSVRFMVQYDF